MKKLLKKNSLLLLSLMVLFSCGSEEVHLPKPKGLNHISLPEHKYVVLDDSNAPYTFEHSAVAQVIKDTSGFFEAHWKKIVYPQFKAIVDIDYKPLNNSPERLDSLITDSWKLSRKHNVKASKIEPKEITISNGNQATLFYLAGEVPSQFQFYTHDSTSNFMRGVLYFNDATKNDSLAPVINFIEEDMMHMLNTLEWKN